MGEKEGRERKRKRMDGEGGEIEREKARRKNFSQLLCHIHVMNE